MRTPTSDGKANSTTDQTEPDTFALLESFSATLRTLAGIHVRPFVLKPSSPTDIFAVETSLQVTLPSDVKSFLERGLTSVRGILEHPVASVGFDFLDANKIVKHTQMLRDVAPSSGKHAALIRAGVALTFSEPELVIAHGTVYHFSFRNPLRKVAGSFSEFLKHYLAAGCFSSHDFRALWTIVGPHVPIHIPPAKNAWVKAYKRAHPEFGA